MQKLVIVRINYDAMRETWKGGKAADAPLSELQHYLAISGLKPWRDGEHVARMVDLHQQLEPTEYEILRDVPLPELVRARRLLAQDSLATSCKATHSRTRANHGPFQSLNRCTASTR